MVRSNRSCLSAWWITIWILMGCSASAAGAPTASLDPQGILPQLSVNPARIVMEEYAGSVGILYQDAAVNSSDGTSIACTASVQAGGSWLTVANVVSGLIVSRGNSVSTATPGTVRVIVDDSGLQAGVYQGVIAITAPSASNSVEQLSVTLTVRSRPVIMLYPNTLSFSHLTNYSYNSPAPQTISVFGGTTNFRVSVSSTNPGWLTVSPSSGTTPAKLNVEVNPAGLTAGTYQGVLTFTSPDAVNSGVLTATVQLTVADQSPPPTLSPSSIELHAQYESRGPVSETLSVYTNGFPFSVSGSAGDVAWLTAQTVKEVAGTVDNSTATILPNPAVLKVSADPTGLAVGTYSGNLTVGDPSLGITVPVSLRITPNDLVISQFAYGADWNTEITLVNIDTVAAPFTLKFWQPNGNPLEVPLEGVGAVSEYSDTIPVGGTKVLRTASTGPDLFQGWVEVVAQGAMGGNAVFSQGGTPSGLEAVVPAATALGSSFALPYDNVAGYQTGVAVVNTAPTATIVSADLRDENGSTITSGSFTLPPHGSRAFFLPIEYPQLINRRGLVLLSSSNAALTAIGLRFSPGGTFASIQPSAPPLSNKGDVVRRTVPQIADGSGWKTTLALVNPGSQPLPFSLVFHDPQPGTFLGLPLLGVGKLSEYSDVIPPGGVRILETPGASNALSQGWAEIASAGPLRGTVIFAQSGGNSFDSEAAATIAPPPGERFVIPFDNTNDFSSALALLNESSSQDYLALVTLRDENGQRLTAAYLPVKAGSYQTFFLSDWYPASKNVRGTIEFLGARCSALGLRFNPMMSFTSVTPMSK